MAAIRIKRNGKAVWNLSKETKSGDHAEAIRWMKEKEENSHLRGREVRTEPRHPGTRGVDQCHGWMEREVEVLPAVNQIFSVCDAGKDCCFNSVVKL